MSAVAFVATVIAPTGTGLTDGQVTLVEQRLKRANVIIEQSVWQKDHQAMDLFFTGFAPTLNDLPVDVLIQPVATRRKKILIADMESTIIEQEMLDELAARIGVGEQVAHITRRAMNGELDFEAALNERVLLLKGQPVSLLQEVASHMTLMPGALALVDAMRRAGAQTWLVSGGFTHFIKIIAERIGFDRFFGNELLHENGVLTGRVGLPILGKDAKRDVLMKACKEYGFSLADCLTVGDGANDMAMLQTTAMGGGLGVAYHGKPRLREVIHSQINRSDLSALIYAQGLD